MNAAAVLFQPAGINLELASVETLSIPDLMDYDSGPCRSDSSTADQAALFRNRNGAVGRDICAYWVRTITSQVGALAGCASHPPGVPGLVMAQSTTRFCLAHELGHVLGLGHNPGTQNLMNPQDYYTDLPPDLSGGELQTMRLSGFRAGILVNC